MEHLFALFDHHAVPGKSFLGKHGIRRNHFCIVYRHTALLHKAV